jgi:hypothetical protein
VRDLLRVRKDAVRLKQEVLAIDREVRLSSGRVISGQLQAFLDCFLISFVVDHLPSFAGWTSLKANAAPKIIVTNGIFF